MSHFIHAFSCNTSVSINLKKVLLEIAEFYYFIFEEGELNKKSIKKISHGHLW